MYRPVFRSSQFVKLEPKAKRHEFMLDIFFCMFQPCDTYFVSRLFISTVCASFDIFQIVILLLYSRFEYFWPIYWVLKICFSFTKNQSRKGKIRFFFFRKSRSRFTCINFFLLKLRQG